MTENSAISSRTHVLALLLMSIAWFIFIKSAQVQSALWWYPFLLLSRLYLLGLALGLAGWILVKKPTHSLLPFYFVNCMVLQSAQACLENPKASYFYEYVSYFLLLLALSYSGTMKRWLKTYVPIVAIAMSAPLFFRDPSYFSSLGQFAFAFTTPVAISIISFIVIRINISRFQALTENLLLQRQLAETEKRGKEKAKELVAQVTHDIQSPLAALRMLKPLIDTQLNADDETKLAVQTSINKVEGLIRHLDQVRSGMKRQGSADTLPQVTFLPLLLNQVIAEKKLIQNQAASKPIEFRIENELELGAWVRAPGFELQRVFSNLVQNAIEAINANPNQKSGTIKFRIRSLPQLLELRIEDNGQGISPEVLGRLGEKGATFGKKEGTGLGLYHAMESIQSWSGGFEIESAMGQGTLITIHFPHLFEKLPTDLVIVAKSDNQLSQFLKFDKAHIHHFERPNEFLETPDFSNPSKLFIFAREFADSDLTGFSLAESILDPARVILYKKAPLSSTQQIPWANVSLGYFE